MQITEAPIIPLSPDELPLWRQHPSHLFENYFDPAIVGVTLNASDRLALAYDEEKLIDLAIGRLKDDAEAPDDILWEDGAMWVTDGLDLAIEQLGNQAPLII